MDEPRLRESLRLLPEHRAGDDFTAEVMARIERFERRREAERAAAAPGRRRLFAAVAVTAAGAAAVAATVGLAGRGPAAPAPPVVASAAPQAGAPGTPGTAAPAARAARPAAPAAAVAAPPHPVAPPAAQPATEGGPPPAWAAEPPAATLDRAVVLARLARLDRERAQLAGRLAELRSALPPEDGPRVLLGGDDGLELVLDLGRPATPFAGGAVPAVHRPDDDPPRRL